MKCGDNEMKRQRFKINQIVMTAMFMGMIIALTMIIRVPIPGTHGYIHLGDSMIFLAVLALGKKNGAIAAGFGSALADVIGGYAIYAPVTLVVKALMAVVVAAFIEQALKRGHFAGTAGKAVIAGGMIAGGALMVAGYYAAEVVMYGNFIVPLSGVWMNALQCSVGAVLALMLDHSLQNTPAGRMFAYSPGDARR